MRTLLFSLLLVDALLGAGCLDWANLGGGPGGPHGREGEGEAGEGEGEGGAEGEGSEGEGEGSEGEGEGASGPRWIAVDAPITAQAELAAPSPTQLSSSHGRLFAVGAQHVFELVSDALTPIAAPVVPCANAQLTGPVVVDGSDLLVATDTGAVRFHDDGSCAAPYNLGQGALSVHSLTTFAGGVLLFDGQTVHLLDSNGTDVADHAFDSFTEGTFAPDPDDAQAVLLVRGDASAPGQEVRITEPASDLVVSIVSDDVGVLAGGASASYTIDSALGAPFLHLTSGATTVDLRLDDSDGVNAVAADPDGELAFAGSSALLAHADLSAQPLALTSLSGDRFGAPTRIVTSPGGEVWAVGAHVILWWSSSAASSFASPSVIYRDQAVNASGGLVAIDGSLFFEDTSERLHRADVAGNTLDIVQLVDNVSFQPVFAEDSRGRFAFLPASGSDPARLVEVGGFSAVSFELTPDLGAVTATLSATTVGSTESAAAVLPDASKAAFIVFGELYTCSLDIGVGVAPTVTCDGGRSTGLGSVSAITIVDPSPGVDDETYVLSGSNDVSIVAPGQSPQVYSLDARFDVPTLLVHGCVLSFSSSSWNALDQAQPSAPKGRRGFSVGEAAVVGDRVLLVGGDGAGQLATIPAPTTSTCLDASGHPVLDGAALLGGAVRSQTELDAAAFLDGELYALDADGALWHVPTP